MNEEGVPCKEQRDVHSRRATHARALRQERTWCIKVTERRPLLLKGRIRSRLQCGEVDHVRSFYCMYNEKVFEGLKQGITSVYRILFLLFHG